MNTDSSGLLGNKGSLELILEMESCGTGVVGMSGLLRQRSMGSVLKTDEREQLRSMKPLCNRNLNFLYKLL